MSQGNPADSRRRGTHTLDAPRATARHEVCQASPARRRSSTCGCRPALSSSPPCTTGGTVINEDLVDAQLHAAPAMELVVRGREQSRVRHRGPNTRKKIVPSAGPRSRESPDVPQPTLRAASGRHVRICAISGRADIGPTRLARPRPSPRDQRFQHMSGQDPEDV